MATTAHDAWRCMTHGGDGDEHEGATMLLLLLWGVELWVKENPTWVFIYGFKFKAILTRPDPILTRPVI